MLQVMNCDIRKGFRVVRGPDWNSGEQDGGAGHVGTIVDVGGQANSTCPDGTVDVLWDNGKRGNYRSGFNNADDLLLLDTAPAGKM